MKKSALLLWLTFFSLLFGLRFPVHVQAQTPFQLTVSPPVSHLTIQAGKTVVHSVYLENNGQTAVEVTPTLKPFGADNTSGNPVITDTPLELPYLRLQNSDLSFGNSFQLKPGDKQQFVLEFKVPADAVMAEDHFVLLFETTGSNTFQGKHSATQVSGQIASTFIVSIVGEELPAGQLQVTDIQLPRFIDSFASISPKIVIQNTGTYTSPATGQVSLSNWGQPRGTAQLFPTNVLPNSSRVADQQIAVDASTLVPEPLRFQPRFLIGPVTVSVQLDQVSNQSVYVYQTYAVPFVLLGLVGVGILLTILYFRSSIFFVDKPSQHK